MTKLEELTEARLLAASGEAREIRQAAGATQADVAEDAGITKITALRWERGLTMPHGDGAIRWLNTHRRLKKVMESHAA